MQLRPKSLSGLIFIGYGLIALPLLVAVVNAAWQMDRLARKSEALVQVGVHGTQNYRLLLEQLTSMERNARLYQVLGDNARAAKQHLDIYKESEARFNAALSELEELSANPARSDDLQALGRESGSIFRALQLNSTGSGSLDSTRRAFERMSQTAGSLSEEHRGFIDRGLSELEIEAREAQRKLAWQSAALIPTTLVLTIVFTILLARPIRQIDKAISELGGGAFSRTIRVTGPRDLEALGRQLEWLRKRLLELALERNKFLRHMSHELKTPLANIREGTELLMDGSVGELETGQQEVTSILHDNGLKLQQLIENLLSFSAWQAKNAELQLTEFKLLPLIKRLVRHHQLTLASNNVKLKVKARDISIFADREKLRMVLDNLISNATKFTPPGGTIHIMGDAKGGQLVLEVADTGPGIPASDRAHIFEAFYQGKLPQGGHLQGTGIGLSVVMECVHAHGGTVEIVDGRFKGAHFRIRLPLDQPGVVSEHQVAASA